MLWEHYLSRAAFKLSGCAVELMSHSLRRGKPLSACLEGKNKEMDMHNTIRSGIMAATCVAIAAGAFVGEASAGPINMVSSPIIKTTSATEQIYYRRYYGGRYYRRGYAYGPRRYYGYPAYGYGYPYAYPVAPVPVPFFGW
jgi:hypothetical protein